MATVQIINPEECKNIFINWGNVSKICYNSNPSDPSKIGKGCMATRHFSGSRGDYIKFLITDIPRLAVDEMVRHEQGVFKNVQSFRYVGKESFSYSIPKDILNNEQIMQEYINCMDTILQTYGDIQDFLIQEGKTQERANEQARYVLPMATNTALVIGFTIEGLIHLANLRLCVRADDEIRAVTKTMVDKTIEIIPELKNKLVPNCQELLYCPEGKRGCGAYPSKKELKEIIERGKNL